MVYRSVRENESKFKTKDIVRVLPGVKDPDFKTDLGGWSGSIEEVDLSENGEWLYSIRWDRETLSMVGDEYIDKCEDENLDYELIYLEEKELGLFDHPEIKNGVLFA